jgi:hypothetical protein
MPTMGHDQRSSLPAVPARDAELRDAATWLLHEFSELAALSAAASIARSGDRRGAPATAGTIAELALQLTWNVSSVERTTGRPSREPRHDR